MLKKKRRGRRLKQSKRLRVPSNKVEKELFSSGYSLVAGVDEVGRGAWAGPLVAAAVILPSRRLNKIRDSKLLLRGEREKLTKKIKKAAVEWAVGEATVEEINEIGVGKATLIAYVRALAGLKNKPDFVLIDAFSMPDHDGPQRAIIKGDQTVLSIAAASIIAKVHRDSLMRKLHRQFPGCKKYRFDLNKGYPSPRHKETLKKWGPCELHRTSFAPVRALLK